MSKISLNQALSDGASQAEGATSTTNIKIDETVNPRELLATSMTLEEADEWFRGYKAFDDTSTHRGGGVKKPPPLIKSYKNTSNLVKRHVLAKIDYFCPLFMHLE